MKVPTFFFFLVDCNPWTNFRVDDYLSLYDNPHVTARELNQFNGTT